MIGYGSDMDKKALRYPLGIQTFPKIIEGGYVYVDKTEYVYNMTRSSYVFLSRPRRFGKSLLTSTLESYFEGRKELFKGLAIEKLENDWIKYPVLHFSLATAKHGNVENLKLELNKMLCQYERIWGRAEEDVLPNQRLMGLIQHAYEQTGQKVVLLIDEYDAPLLDVMHEDDNLMQLRRMMQDFYSPIKDCDRYLRFVFITGITKFSQLSIFSELNNLRIISMDKKYAGICGITEEEMLTQLDAGIEAFAEELQISKDEAIQALKDNYDGYHFANVSPDIYNPFSLLNALEDKSLNSYWFASGTPSYLIEMLQKFGVSPSELGTETEAVDEDFDAAIERMTTITPLLYHSGYITIKGYDEGLYTLGIPNKEIRVGLMRSLLPNYLGQRTQGGNTVSIKMGRALAKDDIGGLFDLLKKFLASIPYVQGVNAAEDKEGHWQQMLYVIFSLLGATCDVEVHTPNGRVDLVAQTANKLYLIEVKLNQSAEAAMKQIDLKDYAARFALSALPVVKVGVNFSQEERNITDWNFHANESRQARLNGRVQQKVNKVKVDEDKVTEC